MSDQPLNDLEARRFLLGELPPEEQGRIEELAFEDRDTFAFLESVEDDLIDEFIQGDLSAEETRRFESHFLSLPGRRNNLRISRVLQKQLDKVELHDKRGFSFRAWFELKPLWLRVSLTATVALLLVIIAIWIFRVRETEQSVPLQAGPGKPPPVTSPELRISPSVEPTPSPVHVENKPKSVTPERHKRLSTYALLLPSPSLRTGEGVQQLAVPPGTASIPVGLALITQRSFTSYDAVLQNEAGAKLQNWTNLKAVRLTSGKALKIEISGALLKPHEFYRVGVTGVSSEGKTEVAQYPFEVKK